MDIISHATWVPYFGKNLLFKKLEASQVVEFAHDATLQFMPVPHHPYREELLPNIPSNLSSVS